MFESLTPELMLIGARIAHFASTMQVTGILVFLLLVELPSRNSLRGHATTIAVFRSRLLRIAGFSIVISIASGAAWLVSLATRITGSPAARVISDGTVLTLLSSTQFGHDWVARLILAAILAVLMLRLGLKAQLRAVEFFVAVAVSVGYLGTLAWAGHGGATPGVLGYAHAMGDMLHLIAAGAWIGGLFPLSFLLLSAGQTSRTDGAKIAHEAAVRFSTLGMVAVATLTITGLFNTWILVGGVQGLVDSVYGVLLLLKIALFLAMLTIAAFNRNRLTRDLASPGDLHVMSKTLCRLRRNCLVETALGLAIIIDVSILGTIYHGTQIHP